MKMTTDGGGHYFEGVHARACMRVHMPLCFEAGAGGGGSNFPALGTRQKMGLLSKTALGPSWRGSDSWKAGSEEAGT